MSEEFCVTRNATGNRPEPDAAFVQLPSVMTVETAESLWLSLKSVVAGGVTKVTLDASQVENVTVPGLQLVASLQKTLGARGGGVAVGPVSAAWAEACRDAGFDELRNSVTAEQGV